MFRPSDNAPPLAAIFGCGGPTLSDAERDFFRRSRPAGFILFARNVEAPAQVERLVADLRACIEWEDAPVLIDQEGGRVARLRPPHWRAAPPAKSFGDLARGDREAGRRGAYLNALLLGVELRALGISVDCAPVLDLREPDAHDIIGDRAFSDDPEVVTDLGRAACEGFLASGVLPVIKHVPGHGRALVDSHEDLPRVSAPLEALRERDFQPFRDLSDMPIAMTAHIIYEAIDPDRPATTSKEIIASVIRSDIGFSGLLVSDDLSMQALRGAMGERTEAALEAGCDIVLHCNGDMTEMEAVAEAARPLAESGAARLGNALSRVEGASQPEPAQAQAALDELSEILDS